MRRFVVAVAERRRSRGRKPRTVVAETAEHAIARVASSLPVGQQAGVYEAWPVGQRTARLRVTLAARRGRG